MSSRKLLLLSAVLSGITQCAAWADNTTFSGNASWYGQPFHGKKTASGEIFDMNKLSGAHKSLPMISKVMVENPKTGKSAIVRVNDRGPFVKTRVMDLSRQGAQQLGYLSHGTAYLDFTVLGKDGKTKVGGASTGAKADAAAESKDPTTEKTAAGDKPDASKPADTEKKTSGATDKSASAKKTSGATNKKTSAKKATHAKATAKSKKKKAGK